MKCYMNSNFHRFQKQVAIVAYCQPECSYIINGVEYPTKTTGEQYDRMKSLGVNIVLGNYSAIQNFPQDVLLAMDLCAERDMLYLLNLTIFNEFLNPDPAACYMTLSDEQKQDLKERFLKAIEPYASHPSFGGLNFVDEPSRISFEGIAAAQKIFLEAYPKKLFYVNMFQYFITPRQYAGGKVDPSKIPARYTNPTKEENYTNFMADYLDIVEPQLYSYDLYPMSILHGVYTNVHRGFYELPFIVREYLAKTKRKIPFWSFMQCGGRWEGSLDTRVPTMNECFLMVHATMAMGATGLEIFPYSWPDIWTNNKDVDCGIIDYNGNLTERYHFFKQAFDQVKASEEFIMSGEHYGVHLVGKFEGLTPSKEEVAKLPDSECFYVGEFDCNSFTDDLKPIADIQTTSQLMIGCFDLPKGKRLFYIVNNSITHAANATITLQEEMDVTTVRKAKRMQSKTQRVDLPYLLAGEGVALVL